MTVGYLDGVLSQPENLRRSADSVRAALPLMEMPGGLVAFGMGASSHAAAGFAAVLRDRGVPAISFSAADLMGSASVFRRGAGPARPVRFGDSYAYLGISQSGRSRETVEALDHADGPRIALTNDPDGPLGRAADVVVPLGCGEDSAVSTLSYTATVQALGLIADHLTGVVSPVWDGLPDLVAGVLSSSSEPIADALDGVPLVANRRCWTTGNSPRPTPYNLTLFRDRSAPPSRCPARIVRARMRS